MKNLLFALFTFTSFLMYSQKTEIKTIDNKTIKSIIIKGDAIFKIKTKTTKTNIITIISKIEGEEAQNTTIINEIKNDTLLISSAYKTFLEKNNDKLSAHKQLSIEVSIEIPEHLYLSFKSKIASAEVTGKYKQLILELNQGNVNINNFYGNAIINTINGNISIETNYANITALTKTGKINMEDIVKAKNEIIIHSINGNINIFKTKK